MSVPILDVLNFAGMDSTIQQRYTNGILVAALVFFVLTLVVAIYQG